MRAPFPPAHVHFFADITSEELGHHHVLRLYTFSVNGSDYDGHVHHYQGITGIKYGHYHTYYGVTGPPIPLPGGNHTHDLEGIVELNLFNTSRKDALEISAQKEGLIRTPHRHSYAGTSGPGFGYEGAEVPPGEKI
ncbi:YmaF family protein [Paenibacillus hexagrammi]|uniref:YmaF family protein n=1 Tax=Paenibacillus hexagrammi TaxID=2908839 RepID=A0ABY3SDI5_9BACL|nr:YmaF family protein [Paenibacillus sp. YPD9-1]UJF31284.1 YmaF family protein [Paenibacillus sp. YPD9-1]